MGYDRYMAAVDGTVVRSNYDSDGDWIGSGPDPRKVMKPWLTVRHTDVIEELVKLASERTGVKAEYRPNTNIHDAEKEMFGIREGSVWVLGDGTFKGKFVDELDRLTRLITRPLNEPILGDDHLVYGSYMYVVDGKVTECEHFRDDVNSGITVAEYKRRYQAQEVRRCDIEGRINRLPPKSERSSFDRNFRTQMGDHPDLQPHRWNASGRTINQAHRRRRNSNKIKKVKA